MIRMAWLLSRSCGKVVAPPRPSEVHSSTVPGLGMSRGRGGATTFPQDLVNSDAILIMGSNMAEAHPVAFANVVKAKEQGTKVMHVDPHYSRTSALANLYVPTRAGSDIVFLGAIIRHVLETNSYFHDYVVHYTNAATLVGEDFKDTEELDGLFSGYDPDSETYTDQNSWDYQRDKDGRPLSDPTLQHPRCVLQMMRRHFARYTPEMVENVCGVPRESWLQVAQTLVENAGRERTSAICYAVGWTQQSKGVQIIRAAAILQLLLGNIGRPGGGIMALRGHASIQGSTDIPTLYDMLPGYLPMPLHNADDDNNLAAWIKTHKSPAGWWNNIDKYIVSLLKAYYGDAATKENDFGFEWLPRLTGDHSHFGYWLDMADGKLEGLFVMGQNPAVGAPNARLERRALSKLKRLVVRHLVEVRNASVRLGPPRNAHGQLP